MLSSPHSDIESMAWAFSYIHTADRTWELLDGNLNSWMNVYGIPDPDLWVDLDLRYLYDIVGRENQQHL